MKIFSINSWTKVAITMFFIGISVLTISLIIFAIHYFSLGSIFDSKVASELGGYISGFVGVFWTGAGTILVYATFQEQKKLLEKQQFESSFFKLLDTYNGLIASIPLKSGNKESGKTIFRSFLDEVKNSNWNEEMWRVWLTSTSINIPEVNNIKRKYELSENEKNEEELPTDLIAFTFDNNEHQLLGDRTNEFYFAQFDYFFNKCKSTMEPYGRFIYNVLKYVDEENKDKKTAAKYLKILWSQMTEEELVVLFYYAKNKELQGQPKFLNWLKKYNFLNDLSDDVFLRWNHKKDFANKC